MGGTGWFTSHFYWWSFSFLLITEQLILFKSFLLFTETFLFLVYIYYYYYYYQMNDNFIFYLSINFHHKWCQQMKHENLNIYFYWNDIFILLFVFIRYRKVVWSNQIVQCLTYDFVSSKYWDYKRSEIEFMISFKSLIFNQHSLMYFNAISVD